MDKKRLEIIATVVLIIIFIFTLVNSIKKVGRKIQPSQAASGVSLPQASVPQQAAKTEEGSVGEGIAWGRCPFSGKIYSSAKTTDAVNLRLVGIVWDTKNPQAIINGKIVQEGDTISGFMVVKIMTDKVKLLHGDKYIEIKLEK